MVSVIITNQGAAKNGISSLLAALDHPSVSDSTILANANGTSVAQQLINAAGQTKGEWLLIVDGRLSPAAEDLGQLIELVDNSTADLVYTTYQIADEIFELPYMEIDNLIPTLSSITSWPLGIIALRRSLVASMDTQADEPSAIVGRLLIAAIANNHPTEKYSNIIQATSTATTDELLASDRTIAAMLGEAVNACNIEELFPNHAWQTHEQEAAAACYHTLAALFLRLADLDSARECLSFSDQLEDSPRSLALKGLLSMESGETLGAVANMVSSLQQYEVRKTNRDNQHYLTFIPTDLEQVNRRLHAGLAALNSRDNETALSHFTEAVFSFDSFYTETGLDRIRRQ